MTNEYDFNVNDIPGAAIGMAAKKFFFANALVELVMIQPRTRERMKTRNRQSISEAQHAPHTSLGGGAFPVSWIRCMLNDCWCIRGQCEQRLQRHNTIDNEKVFFCELVYRLWCETSGMRGGSCVGRAEVQVLLRGCDSGRNDLSNGARGSVVGFLVVALMDRSYIGWQPGQSIRGLE